MKKFYKTLALLICLLLTLSVASINVGAVDDTLVSDDDYVAEVNGTKYTSLSSAISASTAGDTVTLLSDVTLSSSMLIKKDIILDLDSYTIYESSSSYLQINSTMSIINGTIDNSKGYYGIWVVNGTLTIEELSINVYYCGVLLGYESYNYYGNLIMNSGQINVSGNGGYGVNIAKIGSSCTKTSSFVMNDGTINASFGTGVYVGGSIYKEDILSNIVSSFTLNDGEIYGYYYGISGTGNYDNTQIDISGGSITGEALGIYHPQYGILNISGGTITSNQGTGIEMRAGQLNITGGTIETKSTEFCYVNGDGNGNYGVGGYSVCGAALSVSQHSTDLQLTVNISGGTLTGLVGLFEADLRNDTSREKISVSVTGGTIISTGTASVTTDSTNTYSKIFESVYSQDLTKFISSGTFKSDLTYDNNISLTNYDLDPTYVSSSSIAVYVISTDTTYVGTVTEINSKLNDLYDDGDIEVGDIVTVYVVGDNAGSVALTGLSCVKIVNLTDDTVTINGLEATSTGITTHPYAVYYEEVEATCTEEGSSAYYYCSICDHYFEDKDCQIETIVTYSDATGHDWDYDNVEWTYSYDEEGNVESATGTVYCLNDASHILTFDADIELYDTSEDSDGITYTFKVSISDDDGNELAYTYFDKYVENQVEGAVVDDGSSDEETGTTEATSNEATDTTDTSDSYSIMLYMMVGLASLYGIKTYRKREEN